MTVISQYVNGNCDVTIHSDGTRIVQTNDDKINLDYPLNLDVRLSRRCAFGMNPVTGKAVCEFCHESATTDGKDATLESIDKFFEYVKDCPGGTELAVGINWWTLETNYFLDNAYYSGFIVNVTVNQGHLHCDLEDIGMYIDSGKIHGLGISYRPNNKSIPVKLLNYGNTIVHTIVGINTVDEVKALAEQGVRKILILGEKDFGFNLGKVVIKKAEHLVWYRRVHELFSLFDAVSFDNLALEQLGVKRFVKDWNTIYQHENSFYVNLVDETFSPSSRSPYNSPMCSVKDYFRQLKIVL